MPLKEGEFKSWGAPTTEEVSAAVDRHLGSGEEAAPAAPGSGTPGPNAYGPQPLRNASDIDVARLPDSEGGTELRLHDDSVHGRSAGLRE